MTKRGIAVLTVLVLTVVVAGGLWFYQRSMQQQSQRYRFTLEAVSALKQCSKVKKEILRAVHDGDRLSSMEAVYDAKEHLKRPIALMSEWTGHGDPQLQHVAGSFLSAIGDVDTAVDMYSRIMSGESTDSTADIAKANAKLNGGRAALLQAAVELSETISTLDKGDPPSRAGTLRYRLSEDQRQNIIRTIEVSFETELEQFRQDQPSLEFTEDVWASIVLYNVLTDGTML